MNQTISYATSTKQPRAWRCIAFGLLVLAVAASICVNGNGEIFGLAERVSIGLFCVICIAGLAISARLVQIDCKWRWVWISTVAVFAMLVCLAIL